MHRLTDKLGSVDDALRRFELQRSQNECIRPGSLGVVSREELVSRDQLVQQDGGVGAGGAGSTGGGEAQPLRNVRFADDATGSSHGTTSTPAAATTATPAAGTAAAEAQGSVEGTVVSHGVPPSATHKKDAPPLRPHILGQVMERTPTTTASPTTTKSTTASATTANPTTASATGAATDVAADVAAGMQQLSLVHEASAIENGSGDVEEEAYGEDEEGSEYATDSEFGEEQDEEEDELTRASQLLAYWQQKVCVCVYAYIHVLTNAHMPVVSSLSYTNLILPSFHITGWWRWCPTQSILLWSDLHTLGRTKHIPHGSLGH